MLILICNIVEWFCLLQTHSTLLLAPIYIRIESNSNYSIRSGALMRQRNHNGKQSKEPCQSDSPVSGVPERELSKRKPGFGVEARARIGAWAKMVCELKLEQWTSPFKIDETKTRLQYLAVVAGRWRGQSFAARTLTEHFTKVCRRPELLLLS